MKPYRFLSIIGFLGGFCLWPFSWSSAQQAMEPENVPEVVVRVNGQEIPGKNFLRLYHESLRVMDQPDHPLSPSEKDELKEKTINRIIIDEVLSQKAGELNVQIEKEEVDKVIEGIQKRFGSREKYQEELARQGLSETSLRELMERSLKIRKLLNREVVSKVLINPEEVKAYYDSHLEEFRSPERMRLRQVFIPFLNDGEKEEALSKIKEAEKRVLRGENFAEVAKQLSQDDSASAGGDLGYLERNQMLSEFEEAAFSIGPGQVSPVVETILGFHLLKVEDHQKASFFPFDQVGQRITQDLKKQKTGKEIKSYIEGLLTAARIERVPFNNP